MKKSLKVKSTFCISFCVLFLICIVIYFGSTRDTYVQSANVHTYNSSNNVNQKNISFDNIDSTDKVLYLSDIPYSKGQVAWGNISLDKTQDNASFTMLLNGSTTLVKKGI